MHHVCCCVQLASVCSSAHRVTQRDIEYSNLLVQVSKADLALLFAVFRGTICFLL